MAALVEQALELAGGREQVSADAMQALMASWPAVERPVRLRLSNKSLGLEAAQALRDYVAAHAAQLAHLTALELGDIIASRPEDEALQVLGTLSAALAAITAAVVGVILNLAVWFAIHTMFRDVRPWQAFGVRIDVPVLASVNGW
eukprot:gene42332-51702_t